MANRTPEIAIEPAERDRVALVGVLALSAAALVAAGAWVYQGLKAYDEVFNTNELRS
ncbi:MAG TPA: hypothetical protein VHB51_03350 [Candidatus Saccharimonadales bacterium]|nr:hypothetical protein [Candidatus Saccharimonadales bacterium]